GQQMIMSTKCRFYSMRATENTDILKHIIQMKRTRNKLHQMGCLIPNSEFQSILVTLLPESWDHFSMSYCGTQSGPESAGTRKVTTQELCNIIGDKYRCLSMTTYYAKDAGRRKKQKVNKVRDPCGICSKMNHTTTNCRFKGKPKCNNCG
ncbi:hypothetical protein PAXRUDRAFT_175650, partial [Paxillus rubicundulus Ve08.2h10]